MANIASGCYECDRACINSQFCGADGEISLPRVLTVRVIANPAFWGFDDGNGNVLTEGEAVFSNGYYDFFDGYDETHFELKDCGGVVSGPYRDENRPDVLYRSVYDPDDPALATYGGRRHYGSDGTQDNINRGGAEAYLIDRQATTTSDHESCDTSDPTTVYKEFSENFGWGTKISTTDTVFKNKTGAWRYISLDNCYDSLYTDNSLVAECDGTAKQSITRTSHFAQEYDEFQVRPVNSDSGCIKDGHLPLKYQGDITTISRASGVEDFLTVQLQYNGDSAVAIHDGMLLGIDGVTINGAYSVFGVNHSSPYTYCDLVGTLGSGVVDDSGGSWIAFNTYDPNTCCGEVAYNISNETKQRSNIKNYHADFGKIFNNNKNITQSNRFIENRYNYGFGATTQINGANSLRSDYSTPSVTSSGTAELSASGEPQFDSVFPYYGPFYQIDKYDTSTRTDSKYNTTKGNNGTCYSKKATLSVFPDCMTQYNPYNECATDTQKYLTNQVSRLGIVYRGCNYEDNCSYDADGRPLAGWSGSAPTGIDDLRRGLAGQEVYMYVNLTDAWGAEIKRDPCGCGPGDVPPGTEQPDMISIPSPVTFASFPKFDLYPETYGCLDPLWQLKFATECEGASYPTCVMPSSDYACSIRQPYTTYGFMRNLCGSQTADRRKVITEGFSSLIQQGSYRNTTEASGNEPMYWEFNNPYIHESGQTGGVSTSGDYSFWGLADTTGRLVAPYFRTQEDVAYTLCPVSTEIPYLNFNLCATRASGWPTDSVPFLIEIDHNDSCTDCAATQMDSTNLVLSLQGLETSYSHGPNSGNKFGFNHCRYKGTSHDPSYICASGFTKGCDLVEESYQYNEPYIGNTCSCINTDITLYSYNLKGTSRPLGWSSQGSSYAQNSFVKLSGCDQDPDNDFLQDVPYYPLRGLTVYGSFKLACSNMHDYLDNFEKTSCVYWPALGNPLDILYAGGTCSRNFPSANSDLQLEARFVIVNKDMEALFESIPDKCLTNVSPYGIANDLSSIVYLDDLIGSLENINVYGCPTYLIEYACHSSGEYGEGFVGSAGSGCNSCQTPTTTDFCSCDGIGCDSCGEVISVDGSPAVMGPVRYQNLCVCDCNERIARIWEYGESGKVLYQDYIQSGCDPYIMAVNFSGAEGSTGKIYTHYSELGRFGAGPTLATSTSACSWASGPNMISSGIQYELQTPQRLSLGDLKCQSLSPDQCVESDCLDTKVGMGSCLDPIPWTGAAPEAGVNVVRTACYPEIMIVNKIECYGDQFKLYVDREYHTHGRDWEEIITVGTPPAPTCFPVQKGAYRYTGATGETVCTSIPFCTPSDGVTPAYDYEIITDGSGNELRYRGICSTNPSSGTYVSQNFVWGPDPITTGEDTLWNYFNLFYEQDFPSSKYNEAIYLGDPYADPPEPEDPCLNGTVINGTSIFGTGLYDAPEFRYGIDHTNKKHSCIQDYMECGSDLFCNKMFFPRKRYAVNTKVSKFGALQMCTSNAKFKAGDFYYGWSDFDETPDILKEIENTNFVDVCDSRNYTTISAAVGIDDTYLIVNEYLPLLNIPSTFYYTTNNRSCLFLDEASCAVNWMHLHSKRSIDIGVFTFKTFAQDNKTSFGYYLDKLTTTSVDNCLFKPFKIMVDVECCSSNIRRKNYQQDAPTALEYIIEDVPSWACNGFVKDPPCTCDTSVCGGVEGYYTLAPKPVCLSLTKVRTYGGVTGSGTEDLCSDLCSDCFPVDCSGVNTLYVDIPTASHVYNPEIISGTYEGEKGVGGAAGLVGCGLSCGTKRAAPLSAAVMKCGSEYYLGAESVEVLAYECGDYYYIPNNASLPATGCCDIAQTLCDTLLDCWKIPINGCGVLKPSNHADYSADWLNCNCLEAPHYDECSSSVIRAVITEA